MTQIVQAEINGNIEKINTFNFTESMNRFYNILTFTADRLYASESDVVFKMGEKVFTGFIFSADKTSASTYSMVCRSYSARLTEPYVSSETDVVIPATTSHGVCAYYANLYNIPIIITAINLDFSGDFEQKGTVLSALTTIANVTGAEYWFDGTSIRIEPNKAIPDTTDLVLLDTDIFGFVPFSKTIEQRGVGEVVVGAVSVQNEITTSFKCTAAVDSCTGETMARVIPHDSFDSSRNITLTEVKTPIVFQKVIGTSIFTTVDADIVSIASITINGAIITDYSFVADTIIFGTEKRGNMIVDYIGYGLHGYASIKTIPEGRYCEFDIYYGACEVYGFQEMMSCDSSNDSGVECGGVYVIMPNTRNYAAGFAFFTIGGNPFFTYYSDQERFYPPDVHTPLVMPVMETGAISQDGGIFTHTLRFDVVSINEVRSNGETITPTLAGRTLSFDQYYTGVIISYNVNAIEHYVKFANYPNENIRLMISGDEEGECDFALDGYDQDNNDSLVCVEGVTATVDLKEELGVILAKVADRGINVTDPNGVINSRRTDWFGRLKIPNTIFGTYTIETKNIVTNSEVKLLVGNS